MSHRYILKILKFNEISGRQNSGRRKALYTTEKSIYKSREIKIYIFALIHICLKVHAP